MSGLMGANPEAARAARTQSPTMTAVGVALGGIAGNPLWEPFRLLMYLFADGRRRDPFKTKVEKVIAAVIGDRAAEALMYGLPRLAGCRSPATVDGQSLMFSAADGDVEDHGSRSPAQGARPPVPTWDWHGGIVSQSGGDETWPKWLSTLPVPKRSRISSTAYDVSAHGPRTTTGVSTDKPPPLIESIVQGLGVRTRSQCAAVRGARRRSTG